MIAITGGTGLLGAHLIFRLLDQGYEVKVLRRSENSTLVKKIISYYTSKPEEYFSRIHWHQGDVTDITSLENFLAKDDLLFHCAGVVSFHKKDKPLLHKINVEGTANVVNAALHQNLSKLIHVSSTSALGRANPDGKINETSQWKDSNNNSKYGISKMLGEREVWRGQMEGLSTAIVNPGIILGPGPWDKGSSQLFSKLYNGLNFYTQGVNGYVDVRDVACVMEKLMFSDIEEERFLLVAENVDYKSLFDKIAKALQVNPPHKEATPVMAEIVWRLDAIRSLFTGRPPLLTKETARTAMNKHYYDGSKISRFIDFRYRPIDESIAEFSELFLKDQKNS
ncbi:MAG: NAD-dependent epimerase/dehydratase family protein [Bacteroidales bacterium]